MSASCLPAQNTYKKGDIIKISLEKNGLGGYEWTMKADSLVSILKEYDETYFNDTTNLNEYNKIFELKALKKGITELNFIKRRAFEADSIKPVQVISKKIIIK